MTRYTLEVWDGRPCMMADPNGKWVEWEEVDPPSGETKDETKDVAVEAPVTE